MINNTFQVINNKKKQIKRSLINLREWPPNSKQSSLQVISLRSLKQHLTLRIINLGRKALRPSLALFKNSTSARSTRSLSPSKELNCFPWGFQRFSSCKSLEWCYLQKFSKALLIDLQTTWIQCKLLGSIFITSNYSLGMEDCCIIHMILL